MILTDREIQKLLKKGLISIEPNPPIDAYDSTAVDLTLDPLIRVFRTSVPGLIIDPSAPGYKAAELIRSATDPLTISDQGWELPRGTLVLAWTRERVDLSFKGKVAARVEGKSGLARIGLGIHVTAPTIHAGFPGTIQLELVNHGPLPIKLRPGMAICQLIIEMIKGTPSKVHKSQFAGQSAR
ncbi:MAG: dCTP deaminase [Xanthobacteraceae bacterium]